MNAAFRALLTADCPNLTPLQLDLCALDLLDLFTTETELVTLDAAFEEWLHRLGGANNIPAYAATLEAQARLEARR